MFFVKFRYIYDGHCSKNVQVNDVIDFYYNEDGFGFTRLCDGMTRTYKLSEIKDLEIIPNKYDIMY